MRSTQVLPIYSPHNYTSLIGCVYTGAFLRHITTRYLPDGNMRRALFASLLYSIYGICRTHTLASLQNTVQSYNYIEEAIKFSYKTVKTKCRCSNIRLHQNIFSSIFLFLSKKMCKLSFLYRFCYLLFIRSTICNGNFLILYKLKKQKNPEPLILTAFKMCNWAEIKRNEKFRSQVPMFPQSAESLPHSATISIFTDSIVC